ncbi:MAG: DnaA regulatory inactivator Hda [Pseudomonadota bacterium]
MSQLLLDIAPDWVPTLDNFIVGRNTELYANLRNVLAASSGCIYIWGEAGSGKTHLLRAAVHRLSLQQRPASYVADALSDDALQRAEMIAVDDVDTLPEAAQITLFSLYNRIRENTGVLLVSGNAAPSHLSLRDDLRTRLGWGLVYQLHALNDDEKALALHQHAHARGFIVSPEVMQYLLRHGRRDLPALLAVLDALDRHCLSLKRTASVPLLKEVMERYLKAV